MCHRIFGWISVLFIVGLLVHAQEDTEDEQVPDDVYQEANEDVIIIKEDIEDEEVPDDIYQEANEEVIIVIGVVVGIGVVVLALAAIISVRFCRKWRIESVNSRPTRPRPKPRQTDKENNATEASEAMLGSGSDEFNDDPKVQASSV